MNETHAIRRIFGRAPVKISVSTLINDSGVTNRIASAKAGILRYDVEFPDSSVSFVGKRKSSRIIANGILMLSERDPLLFLLLTVNHKLLGYNGSSVREAALYRGLDRSLKKYLPDIMGTDTDRFGSCFIAMEELPHGSPVIDELYRAIDAIAAFHAHYYGDEACVKAFGLNRYSAADYRRTRRCLKRMFGELSSGNLAFFGAEGIAVINRFIDGIHTEFARVEKRRTLTHNDYCDRNICADRQRICIFDWELACYQNPEHDIIELLISVMSDMTDNDVASALGYYRSRLSELTGVTLSDEEYAAALRFNTLEFCVNKLSILRLAGRRLKLDYTDGLARNASRMMDILKIR